MDNVPYLESDDVNIIIDIIDSGVNSINEFAKFNVNKRIHPSYYEKPVVLIPS